MESVKEVPAISKELSFNKDSVNGIIMSVDFLYEMFNVEKQFNKREKFLASLISRDRLLHHITKADILTALSLFISCNASGVLSEITVHRLYTERVKKLFPLSFQEFYTSLEKFDKLTLISKKKNEYTNRVTITINHYINKEKSEDGKRPVLNRFIVIHPFVFGDGFLSMSVSSWKLYLLQLCRSTKQYRSYNFFETKLEQEQPVYKTDLQTLLLKKQNSDVKKVVIELLKTKVSGEETTFCRPLSVPLFEKKGNCYVRANLIINPNLVLYKQPKINYRFPLQPEETYTRQANFIEKEMSQEGIGELSSALLKGRYNGNLFRNLVYILKDQSRNAVRHAIKEVSELWKETKRLPYNLETFVERSIRHKKEMDFKRVLREEDIYDYLVYGQETAVKREERTFTFINHMSHLNMREFRAVCRAGYKKLVSYYSSEFSTPQYTTNPDLDWIPGIDLVRQKAEQFKISPAAYEKLEFEYIGKIIKHTTKEDALTLPSIMMRQIGSLERKRVSPKPPYGFKLEKLLLGEYEKMRFSLTTSKLLQN
ncbi:hypothetical protein ACFVAD_18865 [Sutcliffiella sp. NPDC057660]|uniref:hypothetical protein n=1 Tax=Sutcliffiella sp. NPDC057660 TaxID=3346199 RepID=UPI0036951201